MKVRDMMTTQTVSRAPETNVAEAVQLMWENACGLLPVVGERQSVIGVLTDRDNAIAFGTWEQRASEVRVPDVMPQKLFTCTPDDEVQTVLKAFRAEGIRRLPVIDREGGLVGVLSIDDIGLAARVEALRKDVSYADVENTYKAILLHSSLSKSRGLTAA